MKGLKELQNIVMQILVRLATIKTDLTIPTTVIRRALALVQHRTLFPPIINPFGTIWQENYIGTLLPQCGDFILNPPSNPGSRNFEYKRLSEHIVSQVVLRLDAVDLQGDHALRQQRKEFVNQAEEMLARLDDVYEWF